MALIPRILFCGLIMTVPVGAQQGQNPSPMVEHTREHPRLVQQMPPGRRLPLDLGELFIPAKLQKKKQLPLVVHFHGAPWLPQLAAAKDGKTAILAIQIGAGSGVYAGAFADPERFGNLLREAEQKAGVRWNRVLLSCWSAGYGAVRQILKQPGNFRQVRSVLLIDGLHAGYVHGTPGPLESELERDNLEIFVVFARDALAKKKRMVVTHSEIFPGTFASTTETTDFLLAQLGKKRRATLKWGPVKMQQLSEVRQGNFLLLGYAGNSAPDHVDQFHALPQFLKLLRK